jgi:type III secretion protein Q
VNAISDTRLTKQYYPPTVSRDTAALARAAALRRQPLVLGELEIGFTPAPDRIQDPVCIGLAFGDEPGCATVPRALLRRVLAELDPAAPGAEPDIAALLLELALEPWLARLEAASPGLAVALSPAHDDVGDDAIPIGLVCCSAGEALGTIRLDLGPAAARATIASLALVPQRREPVQNLVVPLCVRALATDLPIAELRQIQAGDVILAEAPAGGDVLLVAQEHLVWRGQVEGAVLRIATPRLSPAAAGLGGWMMSDNADEAPSDATLDELPVRLVFELGRLSLPLAELEAIGPGYVFELGRDARRPVDIVSAGRRIGQGEIVAIGEALGVRVTWIGRYE